MISGSFKNVNYKLFVYKSFDIYVCVCVCRKPDNNDPSGRNDLLTGQHYSVSVLLNHHQDHEGWY